MSEAPVDYSFKRLCFIKEALDKEPSQGVRPLRRDHEKKFCSQSLRLSNNLLGSLDGLIDTLTSLFSDALKLAWIDLSYNELSTIDPALTELKELRVLYLHGNKICRVSQVEKLGVLPLLHTLTLHGNSLERHTNYRAHVISLLPHLKSLNFSPVTNQDKVMAKIWHGSSMHKKVKRKSKA